MLEVDVGGMAVAVEPSHQQKWVTSTGAYFYKCGMQALAHHWQKGTANGGDYTEVQSKKSFL